MEDFFSYYKKWIDEIKKRDADSIEFYFITQLRNDIIRTITRFLRLNKSEAYDDWLKYMNYYMTGEEYGLYIELTPNVIKSINNRIESSIKKEFKDCIDIMALKNPNFSDENANVTQLYLRRLMIPIVFKFTYSSKTSELDDLIKKHSDIFDLSMLSISDHFTITDDMLKIVRDVYRKYIELDNVSLSECNEKISNQPSTEKQVVDLTLPEKFKETDLNKLTVNALRDCLTERNIKLPKNARKADIIQALMEPYDISKCSEISKKYTKKGVPKALRTRLWKETFGDTLIGTCYVCDRVLEFDNFDAGHIVAEANGGETTISNLRVVCKPCNQSCSTKNLDEFKRSMSYGIKKY